MIELFNYFIASCA